MPKQNTFSSSSKKLIVGIIIIVLIGAAAWWYTQQTVLKVATGDTIESWDFQGSYNDDGPNEKRARDEIAKLEAGLNDEAVEPTDYILYVSLANQYVLLGEGEAAYENLNNALAIDSETTGLAWHNMGTLMERLGAINTARIAYARAIDAQPQIDMYHMAYISFLMKYYAEDAPLVDAAFARSEEQFQEPEPTLGLKIEWLKSLGKHEEAEEVRKSMEAALRAESAPQKIIID